MRRPGSLWLAIIFFLSVLTGCGQPTEQPSSRQSITILWAKWAPADALQQLTREFTRQTGILVKIKQVPWDKFYDELSRSLASSASEYDMVGGDSQWLGHMAEAGYYTDISAWIRANGVERQMTSAAMAGYCEYPHGSARFWAVPLMGDATGFAYRKDLFEKPQERENFRKKYGYDLGVPVTWKELRDIAEFFYRPADGLFGINIWRSRSYDAVTMGVLPLIWSYGGNLGDPQTLKVRGILNTPQSAQALEMYRDIGRFGDPQMLESYLDTTRALITGKTVMVMGFFAFFPDLVDPALNPYAAVTGFFADPAGPQGRFSAMGGQGLSMISRSSRKEDGFRFLEWFIRPEVQKQWARLGGFSCDRAVLDSAEFLAARPYNPALREAMNMVRDFWSVPEYTDLLEVSQKHFYEFMRDDSRSARDTLNLLAREWENIFELAGYYTE